MGKEYYGDILDDIEDEEQDQEQEGNEMCVGSDLIKSGCKLTRAYDHTHRLNEDACDSLSQGDSSPALEAAKGLDSR
jgi:hypothetical protein